MELYPYALAKIADVGDAWVEGPFNLEQSHQEIEDFFHEIHNSGALPVSAGGDHSVTLPIFRAIAAERPLGMVHFDAHCDTGDDYLGSKFHHGAPFRRAVEEGCLIQSVPCKSVFAAPSMIRIFGNSVMILECE